MDVFISGVSVVGGFSITSTPKQLKDCSIIQLAVKKSEHPPAAWIHNEVTLLWLLFIMSVQIELHVV